MNTNRGINGVSGPTTDTNLIGARGRMVLRHLQQFAAWNAGTPTPASLEVDLTNRIDFTQVGLFGHSRGGEGVRFAYNEYLRSGSTVAGPDRHARQLPRHLRDRSDRRRRERSVPERAQHRLERAPAGVRLGRAQPSKERACSIA